MVDLFKEIGCVCLCLKLEVSRLVSSTYINSIFIVFQLLFLNYEAGFIQVYPFVNLLAFIFVPPHQQQHVVESINLATKVYAVAREFPEELSACSVGYDSSELLFKFYHVVCPELAIHRLVVELINFVILFNGRSDDFVISVPFRKSFVVLSQEKLVFWWSLHWFDCIGFAI